MHPLREASHRDALAAKAYSAAGQATSTLHAMALLLVYQAEELKEMHEGSANRGLMQKLCTVTDLALPVTKVTAGSQGQTMSTLGVKEHHLWLNLAEMREVDKICFLLHLPDRLIRQRCHFTQQFSALQQQMKAIKHILPRQGTAANTHLSRAAPQPARRLGRPAECRNSPTISSCGVTK